MTQKSLHRKKSTGAAKMKAVQGYVVCCREHSTSSPKLMLTTSHTLGKTVDIVHNFASSASNMKNQDDLSVTGAVRFRNLRRRQSGEQATGSKLQSIELQW